MISIDNNRHIIRNETKENQTVLDQKRKEIAERLREGDVIEIAPEKAMFGSFEDFESFEDFDPRILTFRHQQGTVALVLLDKGVLKFNWGNYKYYISDSFEIGSSLEDIRLRCHNIMSVLVLLDQAFEGRTLFSFDSDGSDRRKISWNQISDWVLECPIKYRSGPILGMFP